MAEIEPYENALDAIPGAHPYPRTSRYHDAEIGIHRRPDGSEVRYTKRRLLPRSTRPPTATSPSPTPSAPASVPTCSRSGTSATSASGGRSPTPIPYWIHAS